MSEAQKHKDMIQYYMSKIGDKKACLQNMNFAKSNIDGLKDYFKDDDYISGLIGAVYGSGFKVSETDRLKKALKERGLL